MKKHFFIMYTLLVIAQIIICNYFHLTQYVMLSILPVLILCLPIKYSTLFGLCLAFITGLSVDYLAEGIIGLNALSLVPVAYFRRNIYLLVFGEDILNRESYFSIKKNGIDKVTTALVIAQSIFLFVYIWADGASGHDFVFIALRFFLSLIASTVISLIITDILQPEDKR